MMNRNLKVLFFCAMAAFLIGCSKEKSERSDSAATKPSAKAPESRKLSLSVAETDSVGQAARIRAGELINGGVRYLLAQREADGGWSMGGGANKPAITAMVLKALVQHPDFNITSPMVERGFEVLLGFRQEDGGIYDPMVGLANYTTAVAIMVMAETGSSQFNGAIRDAIVFMRGQQIAPGSESADGDTITEDHPFVGGVSYGKHGRPDLSNLGMWVQAMHDASVSGDDPAMRRVLIFLTRVQNRSESNPLTWAVAGANDGGFVYAPAVKDDLAMGESKAGSGPGGAGLRSYGSMTYVGFKSMLYANVSRDDPRVQAAYNWIRRYWRLDSNPNMPQRRSQEGLYYYYHVFAKALRAWGDPVITDANGDDHNWREELIDALGRQVRNDGSWVNSNAARWNEGNPILATCYSVLALQAAFKK